MPLLDHFHPPLSNTQFWESFHSLWIAAMVERLNGSILPQGYLAGPGAYRGWFEVDVATFETAPSGTNGASEGVWPSRPGRRPRRRWRSRPSFPMSWKCASSARGRGRRWSRPWSWSVPATRIAPRPAAPSSPMRQLPVAGHRPGGRGHRHRPLRQPAQRADDAAWPRGIVPVQRRRIRLRRRLPAESAAAGRPGGALARSSGDRTAVACAAVGALRHRACRWTWKRLIRRRDGGAAFSCKQEQPTAWPLSTTFKGAPP